MKSLRRNPLGPLLLLSPPLVFLIIVSVIPLIRAIWSSIFVPDFTLQYYARIWNVPVYGRVFWITLQISVMTTLACAVLGYPAAYFLASCRPLMRQLLLLCVIVPFFVSVLIRNYVWMVLLQD